MTSAEHDGEQSTSMPLSKYGLGNDHRMCKAIHFLRANYASSLVRSRPKEFSAWECYAMKSGVSITTTSVPTRGSAGRPPASKLWRGGPLRYA
jgi:hypothetical protein